MGSSSGQGFSPLFATIAPTSFLLFARRVNCLIFIQWQLNNSTSTNSENSSFIKVFCFQHHSPKRVLHRRKTFNICATTFTTKNITLLVTNLVKNIFWSLKYFIISLMNSLLITKLTMNHLQIDHMSWEPTGSNKIPFSL